MDILLGENGDIYFNNADIVLANSVRQKIKIRLKWFFQEWRWDDEAGIEYFEYLFIKNPDLEQVQEMIEDAIFDVDEVTDINNVNITVDAASRRAVISFEVVTDEETFKEEVVLNG